MGVQEEKKQEKEGGKKAVPYGVPTVSLSHKDWHMPKARAFRGLAQHYSG